MLVAVVVVAGIVGLLVANGLGGSDDDDDASDRSEVTTTESQAGGDDDTDTTDTTQGGGNVVVGGPEAALQEFMDAEHEGDCVRALNLVTTNGLAEGFGTPDRDQAIDQCEAFVADERSSGIERNRTIHSIDVDSEADGRAVVVVVATDVVTIGGGGERSETYRQEVTMTDEDGWKIDSLGFVEPVDPAEVN